MLIIQIQRKSFQNKAKKIKAKQTQNTEIKTKQKQLHNILDL